MFLIKHKHIKIGHKAHVTRNSRFEGYNKISDNAYFAGTMGYGSYIGAKSVVTGKIGRFCSIADQVVFLDSTHPVKNFVSTSPCFYSLKKQVGKTYVTSQRFDEYPHVANTDVSFVVGNDVYIGYGATIIAPVTIGDGAVIAANSTVTHDVEPFSIVAGTPAYEIRKRFSKEEIEFLQKLKWWDKDEKWLNKNVEYFDEIKTLMEKMEQKDD